MPKRSPVVAAGRHQLRLLRPAAAVRRRKHRRRRARRRAPSRPAYCRRCRAPCRMHRSATRSAGAMRSGVRARQRRAVDDVGGAGAVVFAGRAERDASCRRDRPRTPSRRRRRRRADEDRALDRARRRRERSANAIAHASACARAAERYRGGSAWLFMPAISAAGRRGVKPRLGDSTQRRRRVDFSPSRGGESRCRNEQRRIRRFGRQRLQRADRMPLLGEIFEPAVQERAHAQPLLEDAARGPERTDRAREAPVGMAVHDLGHVRVVVHAKLRRRRELAGFAIDEAVGQVQIERVAMAFEHVEAHVEAVVERGQIAADRRAAAARTGAISR